MKQSIGLIVVAISVMLLIKKLKTRRNTFQPNKYGLMSFGHNKEYLGYEGEKFFFNSLQKNPKFYAKKFGTPIKQIEWSSKKNKYCKYDFLLNKNLYLEIKTTTKSAKTFYISTGEIEHAQKYRSKYWLIHIINFGRPNQRMLFYKGDQIATWHNKEIKGYWYNA